MANDPPDPIVVEADQRAERAKASLRARMAVLERKFDDVKHRIDLASQIRNHPLPAAGIAIALGALIGSRGGSRDRGAEAGRSLGSFAATGFAALGLRLVRELVLAQLGRAARQWWLDHGGSLDELGADDDRDRARDATIAG